MATARLMCALTWVCEGLRSGRGGKTGAWLELTPRVKKWES